MGLAVAGCGRIAQYPGCRGRIASQSVDSILIIIVAAHTGDVTLDGKITIDDLNKVTSNWQKTA